MRYQKIKNSIVIDARDGETSDDIRKLAVRELIGGELVEEDYGPRIGDHGFFLRGNLVNFYHMKSVCPGIVVASLNIMNPEQTRPIAKEFVEKIKGVGNARNL